MLHALALGRPFLASHAYYDDVFSGKYTEMSREVSKFREKLEKLTHARSLDTRPFFFLPRAKRAARLPAREKRGTGDEAINTLDQLLSQQNESIHTLHQQLIDTLYQQLSQNESINTLDQQLSQQNESIHTLHQQLIDTLYQQLSQNESINTLDQLLSQQNESINTLYQKLSQQHHQLNSSTQLLLSVLEGPVGNFPFYPAVSCAALPPSSPSGYYWVRASDGSAVSVYCDMTTSISCGDGGWMRVVSLDFSNASTSCPSGLQERVDSGIRTCGIESSEAACPSVMLSASGVEYTKVCGKILAYQFSSTDGFRTGSNNIEGSYVNGVSLTYGDTPRNHIWTFVAALDELGSGDGNAVCPCSSSVSSVGTSPPSFVGDDYFCDAGAVTYVGGTFYGDNPLWDGSGCGSTSTCCSFNTPPWFFKELSSSTSDDIEMRVCRDESRANEDIAMSSVEIYVQ